MGDNQKRGHRVNGGDIWLAMCEVVLAAVCLAAGWLLFDFVTGSAADWWLS